MATHSMNDPLVAGQTSSAESAREIWRGILIGLIPPGLLIVVVVITILLTALVRTLFAGAGFFVQQQAAVSVLVAGLLLAVVIFGLAVWRVLRRVAVWQKGEREMRARAALWALGVSALVIVLPVLLAFLLPQHPAP